MTSKEQVVDRTVLATALEMSLPDRRDVLLLDVLFEGIIFTTRHGEGKLQGTVGDQ